MDVLHVEALGEPRGLGGFFSCSFSIGGAGAQREGSGVLVPGVGNPGKCPDAKVLLDGVLEVTGRVIPALQGKQAFSVPESVYPVHARLPVGGICIIA